MRDSQSIGSSLQPRRRGTRGVDRQHHRRLTVNVVGRGPGLGEQSAKGIEPVPFHCVGGGGEGERRDEHGSVRFHSLDQDHQTGRGRGAATQ
jgi:hypothetical protein